MKVTSFFLPPNTIYNKIILEINENIEKGMITNENVMETHQRSLTI